MINKGVRARYQSGESGAAQRAETNIMIKKNIREALPEGVLRLDGSRNAERRSGCRAAPEVLTAAESSRCRRGRRKEADVLVSGSGCGLRPW
jgi:hypothetical protein